MSKELALINVPAQLEIIKAKIEKLAFVSETPYKTGGVLDTFGDIKTMTKIEDLIKAYSAVKNREISYNDAAKDLGLKKPGSQYPVFSANGFAASVWLEDIKLRISVINQKETYDKLKAIENKMSQFLSDEDKKALAMKEMNDLIASI